MLESDRGKLSSIINPFFAKYLQPCQSLFVAPCSHTWHYKCIRPMLEMTSRSYSGEMYFQCPNCRNVSDLEAEVDEKMVWDDSEAEEGVDEIGDPGPTDEATRQVDLPSSAGLGNSTSGLRLADEDLAVIDATMSDTADVQAAPVTPARGNVERRSARDTGDKDEADDRGDTNSSPDDPTPPSSDEGDDAGVRIHARTNRASTSTPVSPGLEGDTEGPLTPRNHAGPFVFDGGASSLRGSAMVPRSVIAAKTGERARQEEADQ